MSNFPAKLTETRSKFAIVHGDHGIEVLDGYRRPTTYFESLAHLIKRYLGSGLYAMGFAFKMSGIVIGSIGMVLCAFLNLAAQHKLVQCAEKVAETEHLDVRPSFTETVQYIFEEGNARQRKYARKMGLFIMAFICIAETGFSCSNYLFVSEHLEQILGYYGYKLNSYSVLAIILVPMWMPTALTNLKVLFPLSMFTLCINIFGFFVIIVFCIKDMGDFSQMKLFNLSSDLAVFYGIALFGFVSIVFVLPLRNEIGNPELIVKPWGVLNMGCLVVLILYLSVAFLSYMKYGEKIEASIFLNMSEYGIWSVILKALVSSSMLCVFTMHTFCFFEISYPVLLESYGPFKHPKLTAFAYRCLPTICTYLMANLIPFFGLFSALIGAVMGGFLGFMVPAFMHLVAFRETLSTPGKIYDWFFVIFGFLTIVISVSISIYKIILAFQKGE